MKNYLLRLDDKTDARLRLLAKKQERPLVDLIREAIRIVWGKKAA
jgi:predicted DNA-binding protein